MYMKCATIGAYSILSEVSQKSLEDNATDVRFGIFSQLKFAEQMIELRRNMWKIHQQRLLAVRFEVNIPTTKYMPDCNKADNRSAAQLTGEEIEVVSSFNLSGRKREIFQSHVRRTSESNYLWLTVANMH